MRFPDFNEQDAKLAREQDSRSIREQVKDELEQLERLARDAGEFFSVAGFVEKTIVSMRSDERKDGCVFPVERDLKMLREYREKMQMFYNVCMVQKTILEDGLDELACVLRGRNLRFDVHTRWSKKEKMLMHIGIEMETRSVSRNKIKIISTGWIDEMRNQGELREYLKNVELHGMGKWYFYTNFSYREDDPHWAIEKLKKKVFEYLEEEEENV